MFFYGSYLYHIQTKGSKGITVDALFKVLATSLTQSDSSFQVGNGNALTLNEVNELRGYTTI